MCVSLSANNVTYNEALGEWEHNNCAFVCIREPITVARLREMIHCSLPKNTSRMMAASSGRKPGFYLIRVEKQKIVDVILNSLVDLADDFVLDTSPLQYDATPK